jgi:hypothetical protein
MLQGGDDAVTQFAPELLESSQARKRRMGVLRAVKDAEDKRTGARKKAMNVARGGSSTNREKRRKKDFLMVRKSGEVQEKLKRSLKDQQRSLRAHLKKLKMPTSHKAKRRRPG